jgi:hypothetical protein
MPAGLSRGRTTHVDEEWKVVARIIVRWTENEERNFLAELACSDRPTEQQLQKLNRVLVGLSTRKVNGVPVRSP